MKRGIKMANEANKKAGETILTSETRQVWLDHNMFIIWKPEYILGIPIIDDQHRGITTTINSLYFGTQNNFIKNILRPIVDTMESYTNIHFQTEEMFHEMIAFPEAEEHKKLHRELSSKLNKVGHNSLLNNDPHEFMDFLKKWWINHICNEDLIYRDFFQKNK